MHNIIYQVPSQAELERAISAHFAKKREKVRQALPTASEKQVDSAIAKMAVATTKMIGLNIVHNKVAFLPHAVWSISDTRMRDWCGQIKLKTGKPYAWRILRDVYFQELDKGSNQAKKNQRGNKVSSYVLRDAQELFDQFKTETYKPEQQPAPEQVDGDLVMDYPIDVNKLTTALYVAEANRPLFRQIAQDEKGIFLHSREYWEIRNKVWSDDEITYAKELLNQVFAGDDGRHYLRTVYRQVDGQARYYATGYSLQGGPKAVREAAVSDVTFIDLNAAAFAGALLATGIPANAVYEYVLNKDKIRKEVARYVGTNEAKVKAAINMIGFGAQTNKESPSFYNKGAQGFYNALPSVLGNQARTDKFLSHPFIRRFERDWAFVKDMMYKLYREGQEKKNYTAFRKTTEIEQQLVTLMLAALNEVFGEGHVALVHDGLIIDGAMTADQRKEWWVLFQSLVRQTFNKAAQEELAEIVELMREHQPSTAIHTYGDRAAALIKVEIEVSEKPAEYRDLINTAKDRAKGFAAEEIKMEELRRALSEDEKRKIERQHEEKMIRRLR